MGAGIGAAAGATAGLAGVLLTRGPEAVLAKGSTIEMVLDRPLVFEASEVNFTTMGNAGHFSDGPGPQTEKGMTSPVRRIPF
jgi:type IV secretion system protein VirB10